MSLSRRNFTSGLAVAGALAAVRGEADAQTASVFRHGIASGDPLLDRVIIWTRVTPSQDEEALPVDWMVAEDAAMARIVQRGLTSTNAGFDYTVKVDVTRLDPGKTYYYRFGVRGALSAIGRTRTLPAGSVDRLRAAIVSCSSYPHGFFNAYGAIAKRRDLDFVVHLGDYIYEYGNGTFGDGSAIGRIPQPNRDLVTLADYRQRYAQYRLDPDLQVVHRQNPFIVVWDDHETADNAWSGGAENHNPATQGNWYERHAAAAQAWFEWIPARENPFVGEIYRSFKIGDLVDLIMLDTRYAGRDQQVAANSPELLSPNRTLLGSDQEQWLFQQLGSSQARGTRWRIIGQQVMMGQLLSPDGTPFNPDQWDGYPVTRAKLLQFLASGGIQNVVVLSGDIHSSWGNEIMLNPFTAATYRPQAVEFVATSVTSPAIEDPAQAALLALQIGTTHPHVKYVDLSRRRYMLLDITKDRAQAEWYHLRTIGERSTDETFAKALRTAAGESRLVAADQLDGRQGPDFAA